MGNYRFILLRILLIHLQLSCRRSLLLLSWKALCTKAFWIWTSLCWSQYVSEHAGGMLLHRWGVQREVYAGERRYMYIHDIVLLSCDIIVLCFRLLIHKMHSFRFVVRSLRITTTVVCSWRFISGKVHLTVKKTISSVRSRWLLHKFRVIWLPTWISLGKVIPIECCARTRKTLCEWGRLYILLQPHLYAVAQAHTRLRHAKVISWVFSRCLKFINVFVCLVRFILLSHWKRGERTIRRLVEYYDEPDPEWYRHSLVSVLPKRIGRAWCVRTSLHHAH